MKLKSLFFAALLIVVSNAFGQSHVAGTLSFQAGADFAVHGTKYTSKFLGIQLESDTSGAVTKMFAITTQYSPVDWFSGGLSFTIGSYLEDTADADANGNTVDAITLDLRLYPVNNDKFNLYLGPEFGFSFLEINRINTGLGGLEEVSHYKGPHFGINLGFNWYFASFLGAFAQLDYTRNGFDLKDYTIDGVAFDLTNFEGTLNTFGVGARFGLCFKIN